MMLTVHVYTSLFDISHSVWLNLCIKWLQVTLNRYFNMSSFFGIKDDFHVFTFSRRVWKEVTRQKNVLPISACIGNARALFNTPLKLSEQFVVIIVNRPPSSFDNAHWCPYLCKLFLIQLCVASKAYFSFFLIH